MLCSNRQTLSLATGQVEVKVTDTTTQGGLGRWLEDLGKMTARELERIRMSKQFADWNDKEKI
jgi:hypothetical protein